MIKVPVSLLLNPNLSVSAKLVWIALRPSGSVTPEGLGGLESNAGLSRPTVRKVLSEASTVGDPSGPNVTIPVALLCDRKVGRYAKCLYGVLQTTPHFQYPSGRFSQTSMSQMTRLDPKTVRAALNRLASAGWIQTEQANHLAPISFTLINPVRSRQKLLLAEAKQRVRAAKFKGEALMQEYLSLLVASDHFRDNHSPGYLVNPVTDERLQFDRFYPPKVAFEFNGDQHYRASERFSARKVEQQKGRDSIKEGICRILGITLVKVHARDLSLRGMQAKVIGLLPVRDLTGCQLLIKYLEDRSRHHRAAGER